MRDLGDYEASGRKTNRDRMRLATLSSNPVLHFRYGQYSCVGDGTKGARVSAGSTLSLKMIMHKLTKIDRCHDDLVGPKLTSTNNHIQNHIARFSKYMHTAY